MSNLKEVAKAYNDAYLASKEANAIANEAKSLKETLRWKLIAEMDDVGLDQIRTDDATLTVKTSVVPDSDKDWDKIYAYIKENDAIHLLKRGISELVFREILETLPEGEGIPGLEKTEVKSILTKIRT